METSFFPEHIEELETKSKLTNSRILTRTKSGSFSQHSLVAELNQVTDLLKSAERTPETNHMIAAKLTHLIKSRPSQRLRIRIYKATKDFFLSQPLNNFKNQEMKGLFAEASRSGELPKYAKTISGIPGNKANIENAEKLLALLNAEHPEYVKYIANSRFWFTDTFYLLSAIRGHLRLSSTEWEKEQLLCLTEEVLKTLDANSFTSKFSPLCRSIASLGFTSSNDVLIKKGEQILEKVRELASRQTTEIETEDPFIPPNDWYLHTKGKILKGNYTSNEVKYIAQDLKKRGMNLFLKISPEEISRKKWSDNQADAPNLMNFINDFNHISFFVASEILSIPNKHERANAIGFFINIAERLHMIDDFNTSFAIQAGLNMHCVDRLKQSWRLVDHSFREKFNSLTEIYSPMHNFGAIRSLQKKEGETTHSIIPVFSVLLRDLTFADDGNPNLIDGKINIKKLELLGTLHLNLLKTQRSCKNSTCFATDISKYLVKSNEKEDSLDKLSDHLEPSNHKIEDDITDYGPSTTKSRDGSEASSHSEARRHSAQSESSIQSES